MKISVYYERKENAQTIEASDKECRLWEEADYQMRLAAARDKATVQKRTAQQIMDEDFNRPSFNRNQTETRRHVLLSALDPEDRYFSDGSDLQQEFIQKEEYDELYLAIERLEPQQRELLERVFWEGAKQSDIAKELHISEAAVARRMKRIYAALKKTLDPYFFTTDR